MNQISNKTLILDIDSIRGYRDKIIFLMMMYDVFSALNSLHITRHQFFLNDVVIGFYVNGVLMTSHVQKTAFVISFPIVSRTLPYGLVAV